MATKQNKGTPGKSTGAGARKAIKAAVKKGLTLEQIGSKTNRDGSTISAILGGKIKNPPAGLAKSIRGTKAPKAKAKGPIPKGSKPSKKHR